MPPTSPSVPSLLDSHLPQDADAAWYRAPAIPAKKLKNAIGKYACNVCEENVLALGDGTVFGSAKEGLVITDDTLFSGTSEGTFTIPLKMIGSATRVGGWPSYVVELQCRDGSKHRISMSCFEKKQEGLVAFLNSLATSSEGKVSRQKPRRARYTRESAVSGSPPMEQLRPATAGATEITDASVASINAGLRLIRVCQHEQFEDARALFDMALRTDAEWPLLRGYCRYVGFNGREVDGVFLLSNQRLLLFSMEAGAKIVLVELTRRLLGKLPVPFLDSIACFFLFSVPRAAYVALRGGKENLIARALAIAEDQLLSKQPPLRKVQEYGVFKFKENVAQVDVGTGVWTGMLARKFGVSFSPSELSKSFSVPKDLILPEYETLEPFERLLLSIRSTLLGIGLDYRLDTTRHKLSIVPASTEVKAAA